MWRFSDVERLPGPTRKPRIRGWRRCGSCNPFRGLAYKGCRAATRAQAKRARRKLCAARVGRGDGGGSEQRGAGGIEELVERRAARFRRKVVFRKMASSTRVPPRRRGRKPDYELRISDATWARVWIAVLLLVLIVLVVGFFVSSSGVSPSQLLPTR